MVTLKQIPEEEYIYPGNAACAGCTATLGLRHALKALGKNTILTMPACCTSVIQGLYPKTAHKVPILNVMFEANAASASGVAAALAHKNKKATVLAWGGDGGTYDIGFQALSASAERNDNFIYCCYDNNVYSNTGMQRSAATPYGAWTTTTPIGKMKHRKNLAIIMADHDIPYVATTIATDPRDVYDRFKKAKEIEGFRFILMLTPCPIAWRYDMSQGIEMGKLAVRTGAWILWEKEEDEYRFTGYSKLIGNGKVKPLPIEDYLKSQGRFKQLLQDKAKVAEFQRGIDKEWAILKARVEFK